MRPLILLLAVFSLYSCGVPRPNIQVCIVNAPNLNRKCYNVKNDYNDDGTLKSTAVAVYKANATIDDLNKSLVIDSDTGFEDGLAGLKTWIKDLINANSPKQITTRIPLRPHN